MRRRVALVVNPAAGGGRARRLLPRVEAALRAAGHDVVTRPTASLAHTDEVVAQAVAQERVVLALGGDGTAGRAASAVAAGDGLLGVLPAGRGNDFARAVGLGHDPVRACRVVRDGEERRIDLGAVRSADGGADFLGIASVGFDSEVQERALRSRLPLGRLVYVAGAVGTVLAWRHARFTGTVDGERLDVVGWAVAVANSGVYGGGMRLAPDASVEDGCLDVVTTAATTRRRFLRALPRVFVGTHVTDPSVRVRPARAVELAADRPFRVFADGDPVAALPCTVTVRPGALRVLLPAANGSRRAGPDRAG